MSPPLLYLPITECLREITNSADSHKDGSIYPMARRVSIVAGFSFAVFQAEAQSNEHQQDRSPSPDAVSSFQPSLAVVIGILCVMFSVTFILLIYAKFCHRGSFARSNSARGPGLVRSASRFSSIDKTIIESLPFFRFSSLKGSRDGQECSVCLSKFEDVEILRLLPKCKHAFHISCVDLWLENHSSCPLCRCKVNPDDPTIFTYSNSMRFHFNQSKATEDSNAELFVQREESHRGSSRFNLGSSFRKILKGGNKDEEQLMKKEPDHEEQQSLHKFNHKIVVSDVVFKNRWSNVSSSDLMLLKSEMLNDMSSNRFSNPDPRAVKTGPGRGAENQEIMKIREELEMKRVFESKVLSGKASPSSLEVPPPCSSSASIVTSQGDRRAISEITSFPRYLNSGMDGDSSKRTHGDFSGSNVKDERMRRIWISIARRTVQWFANREKRSQQVERTGETLHV